MRIVKDKTVIIKLFKKMDIFSKNKNNKLERVSDEDVKKITIELAENVKLKDDGNKELITSISVGDVIVRRTGDVNKIEVVRISSITIYDVHVLIVNTENLTTEKDS